VIIALEGLPGSGKTTSTKLLARRLGAQALTETTADHPFLDSVYVKEGRFDLEVELAFLLLHFGAYRKIDRQALTIADYSPVKDLFFAWDMLTGGDRAVFEQTYEHLYSHHPRPDVVLFLDLSPEECLQRTQARGRSFEGGLDLERLRRMHELYLAHRNELGDKVVSIPLHLGLTRTNVADQLVEALQELRLPAHDFAGER
jgi:deoxyadenosine/deoxycytidine kinase